MVVDHSNPLHDGFCRCRSCKPSRVGARADALMRIRVSLVGAALVTLVLILVDRAPL